MQFTESKASIALSKITCPCNLTILPKRAKSVTDCSTCGSNAPISSIS